MESSPRMVRNAIKKPAPVVLLNKSSANSADTRCSTEGTRDMSPAPAITTANNNNNNIRTHPSHRQPQQHQAAATTSGVPPMMRHPTPPRPLSHRRIPLPQQQQQFQNQSQQQQHQYQNQQPQRSLSVDARRHHHGSAGSPNPILFQQEQALFERKLKDDGVAIRKINKFGKSSLRYIKCTPAARPSSQSVGALLNHNGNSSSSINNTVHSSRRLVLSWGRKKEVGMDQFRSVTKGKATDRAIKSNVPADQIVSLLYGDPPNVESLDIEAPTRLDRDKFARAFARFLKVPLDGVEESDVLVVMENPVAAISRSVVPYAASSSSSRSMTELVDTDAAAAVLMNHNHSQPPQVQRELSGNSSGRPAVRSRLVNTTVVTATVSTAVFTATASNTIEASATSPIHTNESTSPKTPPFPKVHQQPSFSSHRESSQSHISFSNNSPPIREDQPEIKEVADDDEQSALSDLTGHGYDQEIVEELHNALTDLRAQLEESRAEAARAVKVAEQAIQSAERSESTDWQNTVTHKAAEAAALAQKRSAAALAQQRLAEERLDSEKRAATFWRMQAELAEEDAGALQTRAAAAEVQRAAAEEQLQYERRLAAEQISSLKERIANAAQQQALEVALERNRVLEMELDGTRRDLENRRLVESPPSITDEATSPRSRKNFLFGRKKKKEADYGAATDSASLLSRNLQSSCSHDTNDHNADGGGSSSIGPQPVPTSNRSSEQVLKVHAETRLMKEQFELLRRSTHDQLQQLPMSAELWGEQVSHALQTSQREVKRLQARLAIECASRRKLLHEVQDLRGTVRVYCRPKPGGPEGCLVVPSQDTILVKEDADHEMGTSFEFDGVFAPETRQKDVYNEIEEVCLSVLDGYRICLVAMGPSGGGKTCTLLGETMCGGSSDAAYAVVNHGVQLLTCQQLFQVSAQRTDRYKDRFVFTVAEVYEERLCDVLAMTPTGELKGEELSVRLKPSKRSSKQPKASLDDNSTKQSKLEIRTDIRGETVVQGLIAVEVTCFEDVARIWSECLEARAMKAHELGIDRSVYEASSHVISTLQVDSTNITTGITSLGQIRFADLAAAEVIPAEVSETSGPTRDWRFSNRSLEALCSVVESRIRFDRSVPFRTSTLTHLLRDSLEGDTKVIVMACISAERLAESLATLKFASRMRRVNVGKATRHTTSAP